MRHPGLQPRRRRHRGLRAGRASSGAGLRRSRPPGDPVRHQPRRGRPRGGRRAALRRAGGARGHGPGRRAHAPRHHRSGLRGRGRARGHRGRHPGRRAPEPRAGGGAEGGGRGGRAPARRPAPGPAQHALPRRHRHGRAPGGRAGQGRRRRLLPRAHRRGQGHDRAVRAAPAGGGPDRPGHGALGQAVPHPHRRGRAPGARGGGAGQAVHQHLALHPLRHRQPAVHDRQRLRARLRAHPGRHGLRLPQGRRPARRRLRRRPLPAQGHHAAGGVQQQQLHPRARGDDGERGPAAVPGAPARAALRPAGADRRHPRHGVQGRLRRPPRQPQLQAQAHPRLQGRRRADHRSPRGHRSRPGAARRGAASGPTCS